MVHLQLKLYMIHQSTFWFWQDYDPSNSASQSPRSIKKGEKLFKMYKQLTLDYDYIPHGNLDGMQMNSEKKTFLERQDAEMII